MKAGSMPIRYGQFGIQRSTIKRSHHVTSIRKTFNGDLLVELTKGTKASAATLTIQNQLADKIPGAVVTRLRHTAEVEIIDLDEVTKKNEVLNALLKALYGDDHIDDGIIRVTGL